MVFQLQKKTSLGAATKIQNFSGLFQITDPLCHHRVIGKEQRG